MCDNEEREILMISVIQYFSHAKIMCDMSERHTVVARWTVRPGQRFPLTFEKRLKSALLAFQNAF